MGFVFQLYGNMYAFNGHIYGVLPQAVAKLSLDILTPSENLNFLHLFVVFPQEVHFPKGVYQKSFPFDIRAIFSIN